MTGSQANTRVQLFGAVGLLLLVFANRVHLLNQMQFHQDEARSAMRMFGTPAQIIAWQPPDWPPLHNLLLGFWYPLASPLPFALRILSVYIFMLSVMLTYRAARRMFSQRRVAWGTTLAYAALGYSVFLSTFVRAYGLALALFSLALWLMLRYFDHPNWRRALPLGLTLAAMFYSTYTAVFAFAILGLYTLITAPRTLWRWWQPSLVLLLLTLPELIRRFDYFTGRVASAATIHPELEPLPQALLSIYQDYVGQAYLIWLVLGGIALALILTARSAPRAKLIWVLAGVTLAPISLYVLAAIPIVYFFEARYTWWALLLIALAFGWGLARLPRPVWLGTGAVLMVLMVMLPVAERYKSDHHRPFEQNFRWLQDQIEPGDVMLVDPNFCLEECNEADSWAYYFEVYLRDRIEIVQEPGDYRRIWYVRADGWHDLYTEQAILTNRIPTIFVGPWDFLIRLYEGPPDPVGIPFENGLRFHGFDVIKDDRIEHPPYSWYEQTTARVRLWWSIDQPLDADYSISLQLLDSDQGRLFSQNDGAPQLIHLSPVDTTPLPSETSQWQTQQYYVDERELTLGNLGTEINAELALTVYQWWDGTRMTAPGVDPDGLLPLAPAIVWGWG